MPTVHVYGASDDLIEIKGAVSEEFPADFEQSGTVLLLGPSGEAVAVRVWMDDEGDWQASGKTRRGFDPEPIIEIVQRPDSRESNDRAARVTFAESEHDDVQVYKVA